MTQEFIKTFLRTPIIPSPTNIDSSNDMSPFLLQALPAPSRAGNDTIAFRSTIVPPSNDRSLSSHEKPAAHECLAPPLAFLQGANISMPEPNRKYSFYTDCDMLPSFSRPLRHADNEDAQAVGLGFAFDEHAHLEEAARGMNSKSGENRTEGSRRETEAKPLLSSTTQLYEEPAEIYELEAPPQYSERFASTSALRHGFATKPDKSSCSRVLHLPAMFIVQQSPRVTVVDLTEPKKAHTCARLATPYVFSSEFAADDFRTESAVHNSTTSDSASNLIFRQTNTVICEEGRRTSRDAAQTSYPTTWQRGKCNQATVVEQTSQPPTSRSRLFVLSFVAVALLLGFYAFVRYLQDESERAPR